MHPAQVPIMTVAGAERLGGDRRALARRVERGELVRVQRGAYVSAADWSAAGESGRHLLRMRALDGATTGHVPFSHWSAAVAHDLPVPLERLSRVHRTQLDEPGERSGVSSHPYPLGEADVVERWGLSLTDVPRTAVDVAAVGTFREGVALADAALRLLTLSGVDAAAALAEAWERAQPRRAIRKVERVLDFADSRAESVGESFSRVTIAELRLPAPVLQQDFYDIDGFIARVDFWWPELGVIGEFDGRIKYFDPNLTDGDPARVLYEEKLREDRLRAVGPCVVRWGWAEAVDPERLRRKLAGVGVRP